MFPQLPLQPDSWRVQQVKNIGSIDEQPLLAANKWEEIKKEGDAAVESGSRTT